MVPSFPFPHPHPPPSPPKKNKNKKNTAQTSLRFGEEVTTPQTQPLPPSLSLQTGVGGSMLVQEFVRQIEEPSHVVVFSDSDHAGCLTTRKSTSSSKLFCGSHMLRSTSTTQGVSRFPDFGRVRVLSRCSKIWELTSVNTPKLTEQYWK